MCLDSGTVRILLIVVVITIKLQLLLYKHYRNHRHPILILSFPLRTLNSIRIGITVK